MEWQKCIMRLASLLDKVGAPAINFCTDGDSTRRQALHAITDNQLDLQSDLGKIIGALHLVDQTIGKNNETNFLMLGIW